MAPLSFADDDAVRPWELLSAVSDHASLLTVADPATQAVHPDAVRAASAPTRGNLARALDEAFRRLRAAQAQGRPTRFLFVYSGHGSMGPGREAYVHLADGPLTRADLYREVIEPSPADLNHLIIDACNAYFLVHKRGDEALEAVRRLVSGEELAAHPNTGVLLSTASEAETQEWTRFRAGIFSHVLRSALAGAADVDDDHRITYDEAVAFFAAASALVPDPAARPQLWARPPAMDVKAPLVDLNQGRFGAVLRLEPGQGGRFWLEDERGVRTLDFNKAAEHAISLHLPGPHRYFLRSDAHEAEVCAGEPSAAPPVVAFASLSFAGAQAAPRGSADQSLRHLFALEYGPSFHRGFVAGGWRPTGTAVNEWAAPAEPARETPANRAQPEADPALTARELTVMAGLSHATGLGGVGLAYQSGLVRLAAGTGFFAASVGASLAAPRGLELGPLALAPYAGVHGAWRPHDWIVSLPSSTRAGATAGVVARLRGGWQLQAGAGAHYVLYQEQVQFFAEGALGYSVLRDGGAW